MAIVVVPRRKTLKPKGRRTARMTDFDKKEANKEGKFASLTNKDIKRRVASFTKRSIGATAKAKEAKAGKVAANKDLARLNRLSGEAARRAQKRTNKQR